MLEAVASGSGCGFVIIGEIFGGEPAHEVFDGTCDGVESFFGGISAGVGSGWQFAEKFWGSGGGAEGGIAGGCEIADVCWSGRHGVIGVVPWSDFSSAFGGTGFVDAGDVFAGVVVDAGFSFVSFVFGESGGIEFAIGTHSGGSGGDFLGIDEDFADFGDEFARDAELFAEGTVGHIVVHFEFDFDHSTSFGASGRYTVPEIGTGGEVEGIHVAALMNFGGEFVEAFVGGGGEAVKAIDKGELIVDIIEGQWGESFEDFFVTFDGFLVEVVSEVEPFVDDDFVQKYVAALHRCDPS